LAGVTGMSDRNKVLIADSNLSDRNAIRNILDNKYEILEADKGDKVMELIYKNSDSILLILINEALAYNDDLDIMQKLSEEGIIYQASIIMILNDSSDETEKVGSVFGVSDFIVKPFNISILKNRIFNVINLFETKNYLEFLVENQTMQLYKSNLELMEQREKVFKVNEAVIEILGTIIEHRNTESDNHIKRIKLFTKTMLNVMAQKYPEYRLDERKINLISNASAMHDIGKIVMPDSILLKQDKITDEEFEILKQHTVKGGEILKKLGIIENDEYYKYCFEICMYHHEKWDGKGYPEGLKGDEIPLSAQVVGIADVYDSMINDTVYRKRIKPSEAVNMILNGECGQFSDKIIDCFKSIVSNYDILAERYKDTEENFLNIEENNAEKKLSVLNRFENIDSGKFIFALTEQFDVVLETNNTGSDIVFYSVQDKSSDFTNKPSSYNELFMIVQRQCHPDDFETFVDKFSIDNINKRAKTGEFKNEAEIRIMGNNGKYNWIKINLSAFVNNYLELESIIICAKNINCLKEKESSLIFNVCHDSVTKLWNGNYMQEYISSFIDSFDKNNELALVIVNIEKFRNINEKYGYRIGNYILKQIADELRAGFSSSDVIGRLSGDIFIILVKELNDFENKLKAVSDNIFKTYILENTSIDITGGIGISMYPANGETYESLLQKASKSAEYAKSEKKSKYFIFKN